MAKPRHAQGYDSRHTELAEQVLLEAWSRLGEHRDKMVLVGGLAPRYLVDQQTMRARGASHCGTMDVDLGVSIAVSDARTYRSIRQTLVDMGFGPGKNGRGRNQLHSFVKNIGGVDVNIDFLTTAYGGPQDSLMRELEDNLRAIQVEGLGLALHEPLTVEVEGTLLSGGQTTERINVCRPIPFVVLKALAFDKRREPKDAYDLVYVMLYALSGARQLARLASPREMSQDSFSNAIAVLENRFSAPTRDGPTLYAQFVGEAGAAAQAYATVREFLAGL